MRIFVNSDDGGKPLELFTHEDNDLDEPGWYYMPMYRAYDKPVEEGGKPLSDEDGMPLYDPDDDAPTGPFTSLTAAFNDAINCNYCSDGHKADSLAVW